MTEYHAPVEDMTFALEQAGLARIAALPGREEATPDLIAAVLEEAGRQANERLSPLNVVCDREGAKLVDGKVVTPTGIKEFYAEFVENGWNAIPFPADWGGQGLPWLVSAAVHEIWQGASMTFALCPLLTQGAADLLAAFGSEELKARFLPKMVSGEWTGTMNLTEPQAGSDLGQVRTRAVPHPDGDGRYLITGSKIFITYGDHDLTDNIVHMVLARLPDAPPGVRGISLFVVPKMLVGEDGAVTGPNDVRCVSLEHKMGIHGSPTAVLSYGDEGGAVGWLVGQPNKGLNHMFQMMNNARLHVGIQGLGVAERALQVAAAYARERVQSRPVIGGDPHETEGPATIVHHPDVRRMLMTSKALVEAGRLVAYTTVGLMDVTHDDPDPEARAVAERRVALLTPVVKAWSTEIGVKVSDLGVQVHGGVGYVEETGAAQLYRDARIGPIYEGTNGIQAADLVGRKVQKDKGAEMGAVIAEIRADLPSFDPVIAGPLGRAADALEEATAWLVGAGPGDAYAAADPYLRLTALTVGGWLMARAARTAVERLSKGEGNPEFLEHKKTTARYFARHLLPETAALAADAMNGAEELMALPEEAFAVEV